MACDTQVSCHFRDTEGIFCVVSPNAGGPWRSLPLKAPSPGSAGGKFPSNFKALALAWRRGGAFSRPTPSRLRAYTKRHRRAKP